MSNQNCTWCGNPIGSEEAHELEHIGCHKSRIAWECERAAQGLPPKLTRRERRLAERIKAKQNLRK